MPTGTSSAESPELAAGRTPSEREAAIGTTRIGIGTLLLAVLLQWIPLVEYLGYLVGAVGVIQVFRGMRVFGQRHERDVELSLAVFAAAAMVAFALDQDFGYMIDVAVDTNLGSSGASVALAAYDRLIGGSAVIAILAAVAYALLAYDLEGRDGRRLLLAGVAAQVVVAVALAVLVIAPFVHDAIAQAFATNTPNPGSLAAANAEVNGWSPLRVLDAIPAVLFAAAYARAYRRIAQGEVPAAMTSRAATATRQN